MTRWPRSLAARTALVLLVGLVVVQTAGLTIHAFDRLDLQRLAQVHDVAQRTMNLYRGLALLTRDERLRGIASAVHEEHTAGGVIFAARLPAAEAGRYARFRLEPDIPDEPDDDPDEPEDGDDA